MKDNLLFAKLKYKIDYDVEDDNNPYTVLHQLLKDYGDVALFAFLNLQIDFLLQRDLQQSIDYTHAGTYEYFNEYLEGNEFDYIVEDLDSCAWDIFYCKKANSKEIIDHFYKWFSISGEIFS
jgi:hypothetical protein